MYHEVQINNKMGLNHFKNSANTCFVHNDTPDLLRNLQQDLTVRDFALQLFLIRFRSFYGRKAESRTVFLDMAVPRKQSCPRKTGNLTSTPTWFSYTTSTYATVISGWLVFRSRKSGCHQVVLGRAHNVTTNIMTNECNRAMRNPSSPPCTISWRGELISRMIKE